MITRDEAYNLISSLNDDAHSYAYDSWTKADELDEEGEYAEAEYQRELASEEQGNFFRELFYQLSEEEQAAVRHYAETDEDFASDFECWIGEE